MAVFRRRSVSLVVLLPLALNFRLVHALTDSDYEVSVSRNEMVSMHDGVKLATDIYRPADKGTAVDGKFPVILERTPYNKIFQLRRTTMCRTGTS